MLSIITINKNNREGLERTLASLVKMRPDEFQWVCIDANSSDGSQAVATAFLRPGDRIISESDNGIYHAMNKGITLATGQQILYLNSGDTLAPGLTSLAKLELDDSVDICLFGFAIRNRVRLPRSNQWRFWSMPTSHQAIVYSKTLLCQAPFNETYRFAGDFEHYLRINRLGCTVRQTNMILSVNEPYGSDQHLPALLLEYKKALLENGLPLWWANTVYWLKTHYLKWALRT